MHLVAVGTRRHERLHGRDRSRTTPASTSPIRLTIPTAIVPRVPRS
jgi:hypothetical protein